jgi:NADPH2:quinone reductase
MRAIRVAAFGGPEVLKVEEIPTPTPAAGQVLVHVRAAGVNPYDTYMRAGTYAVKPPLPYTPGSDAAGVVEAVGAGVTKVKAGDRVFTAKNLSGAYAEYTLALEDQVQPLPEKIEFAQGAGVWVPYATAYHALYHWAQVRAGESLLIHGASGSVGTAALQLAKAIGLEVYGTAGSDAGLELIRREGAHHVFNHTKAGYEDEIVKASGGKGIDITLEMLANVNLAKDLKMMAQNGRVIVIGNRGEISINPRDLMGKRGTIHAFTLWAMTEKETKEVYAGLDAGLESGVINPVVAKEIPLAEAPRAHEEVLKPGSSGKIVLIP